MQYSLFLSLSLCFYISNKRVFTNICWDLLILSDIYWVMLRLSEICWYLIRVAAIRWDLLNCTELYWVLLRFTEFCWYPLRLSAEICSGLLNCPTFYWALLIFAEICWYLTRVAANCWKEAYRTSSVQLSEFNSESRRTNDLGILHGHGLNSPLRAYQAQFGPKWPKTKFRL